ncbi:transcriptional regulator, LacI family [Catenulispora acidiphila DSM 44928]|uniref:Transcriptional regulator, LacI family n=1 Tax=Catenulispora acidiphila (strain DSM 44928 / JCM 14897 / NBRC 102108 / NRRL B-24433 / ID139908) TaxID=479433 RepID=C7Q358_CATAD|nr:LacI family DNA-binding transcriptional regulator [Catenulispora acidiphila]ACU73794.1 transcriptional regulator, LacI family [Catenulispora acidiphila DSM 44928]
MVTIAEVARRAGVSPSTVSYVLSRKRSISEDTRRKVEAAIAALGYHPHAGARALASNRSNVLALMVPLRSDMYVPVIMEIAMAVATEAREFEQDVLLLTKDEGTGGVRRIAGSGVADAMILMDVELDDDRVPVLRETGTPSVLIGLPADTAGLTCVDLDFEATGAVCVDHLADLGHRDIALIGESEAVYRRHTGFAARTLTGFQRGVAERGLRAVHRPCEGTYESAAGVLARILEERPTTTGFVVQNEAAIAPLLSLLRLAGRVVPEDTSVVAICPDQVALQSSPRLTSVSIPAEEMGRRAVRQAMAQLEGNRRSSLTLLPPRLTVRESSAAAPAV